MTRFQTRHSRTSGSNCVSASTRGAGEADDNSASEGLPEDEEEEHRADEEELEDAFREIDVLAEDIRTKRSAYGGPTANHRGTGGDGRVVENDLQKKLSLRTSEAVMAMSSLPGAFDSNGQPLPKPSQQRLINMARDQKEERNHRHNRERYGPNIEPATEQLPIDDLQLRMNTFISLANKEAFEAQQEYQSRQKRRRRRRLLLLVSGIVLVSIVAVVVGIMLGTGGSSTSDNNTGEDGKNDSESLVSERCIASGNESQESNRYQEIRSTLISMNPAMEMSLSVANSTARKSLCWLAYADALEELERGKQYQMLQRFTLVIIYFHFAGREEIQGNSLSQSKWLTSVPVCQWDFLVCDEGGEPDVVTGMLLGGTKLNGRIASEISNLSKLTDLQLTSNALTGEIPKELWTMTRLESLTLAYSQLSGTVSNELAQLVELRYLSLGSRSFNGTFPDIGAMTNLKTLLVSESFDIVGPLPNISGLTNLELFEFINNDMTGSMPTHIGLLSKLTLLKVINTQVTGTLPTELGNLVNLETIDLETSIFSGTLPTELGNISNLNFFSVDGATFLTGTIPSELGRMSILETLIFSAASGLTGTMPAEICALRWQYLDNLGVDCKRVECDSDCCTACFS